MSKQAMYNRHIVQAQSMDAQPIFSWDDLEQSLRILTGFLTISEIQQLDRELGHTKLKVQRRVLLHWYNMAMARQKLIDLDAQCREAWKMSNRTTMTAPLYDRVQAVKACRCLGMRVEQESWTADVIEVTIV